MRNHNHIKSFTMLDSDFSIIFMGCKQLIKFFFLWYTCALSLFNIFATLLREHLDPSMPWWRCFECRPHKVVKDNNTKRLKRFKGNLEAAQVSIFFFFLNLYKPYLPFNYLIWLELIVWWHIIKNLSYSFHKYYSFDNAVMQLYE